MPPPLAPPVVVRSSMEELEEDTTGAAYCYGCGYGGFLVEAAAETAVHARAEMLLLSGG